MVTRYQTSLLHRLAYYRRVWALWKKTDLKKAKLTYLRVRHDGWSRILYTSHSLVFDVRARLTCTHCLPCRMNTACLRDHSLYPSRIHLFIWMSNLSITCVACCIYLWYLSKHRHLCNTISRLSERCDYMMESGTNAV